jgi:hypothetical protein
MDRDHAAHGQSIKNIYVYPLSRHAQERQALKFLAYLYLNGSLPTMLSVGLLGFELICIDGGDGFGAQKYQAVLKSAPSSFAAKL